jgi:uncharacterized RDD family membrane protein YckC
MSEGELEITDEVMPYYTALFTANTVLPRYIAASMDNAITMILGFAAALGLFQGMPVVQFLVLVIVYLGYFFLFEGLVSRTPGKFLTGLVVVGVEGEKCTWGQTAIRTAFRLLEVNPFLFGAIPAALSIVFSPYHQRFGDKTAETLVVERRELRRHR